MMASFIGNLAPFDENVELFSDYADRCASFLTANKVADEDRIHTFLAMVGPATYKLLNMLTSPDKPSTKTYDELITLLKGHFSPTPIEIAERDRFWSCKQYENESVSDFIVRLKSLAVHCNFDTFYPQALRDRLVSGLHPKMEKTHAYFLTQKNLTFQSAKEKALADEMASRASKEHTQSTRGITSTDGQMTGTTHKVYQRRPQKQSQKQEKQCPHCGRRNHESNDCKFKNAKCHKCGVLGHIKPVCKSKSKSQHKSNTKYVNEECVSENVDECYDSSEQVSFGMYNVQSDTVKPYTVSLNVNGSNVEFELDSGSTRTVIDENMYQQHFQDCNLQNSDVILRCYNGELIPLLGEMSVNVQYSGKDYELSLLVVKGTKPQLLGRDWLNVIKLNWQEIFKVHVSNPSPDRPTSACSSIDQLVSQYPNLYDSTSRSTGIRNFTAHINLKSDISPVFQKSRPVPYAIKPNVELEYDRLIESGILEYAEYVDEGWASPAVHVEKQNGKIRVCGDYKAVNECIESDGYKLPNANDMFAKLPPNGSVYSVIDLEGAFNQLKLDESSRKVLAMNTHKGFLVPNRLCFGVKTAPAIFQSVMDQILQGLDNVFCYIDDILIVSTSIEEHVVLLEKVFKRLTEFNVKVNKAKCKLGLSSIEYLGHQISAEGVKPLEDKVEALRNAPRPRDVSELRSFVGMLNFYGKFVADISTILAPLYKLTQKGVQWDWSRECEEAFSKAKQALSSESVLVIFDPNKPIVLSVDASPVGVGAVLSHVMPDKSERPIAFASRTLSKAESSYPQIEKEGLAIVFGIKKFHLFLYGTRFTLITDHQPLTRIFGPKRNIPTLAAARMQRWAVLLSGYQYDIKYRTSADNANADMFSRLPIHVDNPVDNVDDFAFSVTLEALPVTSKIVGELTAKDPILSRVYEYVLSGWPLSCGPEFQPFKTHANSLTIEDKCLLWGRRVIIPSVLRDRLLDGLHECHPGMVRMKSLARSYVWWPGIDLDIEDMVRTCESCSQSHHTPSKVPLLLWPWATSPWQRIHADFAEIKGTMFLVIVDSHSKWLEVFPMNSTTSHALIDVLRSLFARYGLPLQFVSDNGPQFTSEEFKVFLASNDIDHILCPPYHPASNGQAEKYVQTFKQMYNKLGKMATNEKVCKILCVYRNTPHSVTGVSPSELFLKRAPRTLLSLVKPDMGRKVAKTQLVAKKQRDGLNAKFREYDVSQPVKVRNIRGGREKWINGVIVSRKGPNTYIVRTPGNKRRFVHADHLTHRDEDIVSDDVRDEDVFLDLPRDRVVAEKPAHMLPMLPVPVSADNSISDVSNASKKAVIVDDVPSESQTTEPVIVPLRRSERVRKAPERLNLYVNCM